MKQYIVLFEDNRAVTAHELVRPYEILNLARNEDDHIEWLVVFGHDEDDAIHTAERLKDDHHTEA